MRVVFFSNCYLPYLSGITLSIQTLREALEELGHEIFIVGPNYPGHKETDPHIFRLPSLPATYPGYRFALPFSPTTFNRLKEENFDIIHAHQPFGVGLSALYLARKLALPLVYTFHTLFSRYVHHVPLIPANLAKALVTNYLRFFCNQTDTVIAPSLMVKRYLKVLGVKKTIAVVPTGVKLDKFQIPNLANRNPLPFPHLIEGRCPAGTERVKVKLLLFSGRIADEKNIAFLLNAFPAILAQVPNVYLLLCGGGPKEKEYRALAEQISERIIFTGPIPHEELFNYYHAADLFVYSSLSETQGLVLCEAKACGLPIVALFGGGLVDVVRNGIDGYLVPRNREKFIEHVVRLLQDAPLRAAMAAKAREDVCERFSSLAVAKKMETLYNSLTHKGGKGR